ncbi:MAG TPA: recombination mediator RecR [Gammaproteobacteria bacterium]|nr:recombination mediator RecR [Gammaproteobacteria bacterium]HZC01875.1 recombination mediator RecR [Gammaproteobacteria bacterium]
MNYSPLIDRLIEALRCLPGVGPKSAQRIAFHLLERNRAGARRLAAALKEAVETVRNCERCRNFSDAPLCRVCASAKRDASLLCVVESPTDIGLIEQAGGYSGRYFVLMGRLSPLDGIGPDDLGMEKLTDLLNTGEVTEVILATSTTVEGQATAHYLTELIQGRGIRVSRLAQGIPLGGELEFVDSGTLAHAISSRRQQ